VAPEACYSELINGIFGFSTMAAIATANMIAKLFAEGM
jgi:hypothetical protein